MLNAGRRKKTAKKKNSVEYFIDVTDGLYGPSVRPRRQLDRQYDEHLAVTAFEKTVKNLRVPAGCEYYIYLIRRSKKGETPIRTTWRSNRPG